MISRVLLETPGESAVAGERLFNAMEDLSREFPGVPVCIRCPGDVPEVSISAARWRSAHADLFAFDELVAGAADKGSFVLRIEIVDEAGDRPPASEAVEILTRYQRFIARKNADSRAALFARTLEEHKKLHDLSKPLVRADHDHALDTWQWVLRLDPKAGAPVQLAALFHDIERLVSEADKRVEHRASDYQAFKDRHALIGSETTRLALLSIGWDKPTARRAADLVAHHERPQIDPDLLLLNDADALSFFSLNSWGFVNYFGAEHTARKVAYTLRRMRPDARKRLRSIRYHPEVARLLREALSVSPARTPLMKEKSP
jgi:hypothetical protein